MSFNKLKPSYLKPGDAVGIISPSFCIDEEKLNNAVKILEGWDLNVRLGKNVLSRSGPFAGTDEERLSDLQEMTSDPSIKAVICSRGGYGISRIIEKADFTSLKKNPKWYVGFSDITVLHLWLNEMYNLISIHSDMPLNFDNPDKTPETLSTLRDALTGRLKRVKWEGRMERPSSVTSEVTGGNLSLLISMMGTSAEPRTRGKILFIEEVGEYYYHLDRMLITLKMAGKLKRLSALIVGGLNEMNDSRIPWGKSAEDTVLDVVKEYDYPVLFNFPAGHLPDNRAFYIGGDARIEINGNKASLSFF